MPARTWLAGPLLDWLYLGFPASSSAPTLVLGGRPTVGHVALDHGIGVRIPASQPIRDFARFYSAKQTIPAKKRRE